MQSKKNTILIKQLDYVASKSRFYKRKLGFKNIENAKKDIHSLVFTTKNELLQDQQEYPPYGSNLCVSINKIQRIHKTSGTTNKPLILTLTSKDIATTIKVGAACFKSAGLRKDDVVIHCLNYNMWAGGYTDHQSLEKTGAGVIPFGVGNSHNLIETMLSIKPSVIHCTPSYLKKLELILRDDFKLLPKSLGLRLGLFGAEPGLQNSIFRKNIEDFWGLIAMNANYGLSDVLSMFGAECKCQKGLHFFGLDVIYPELIDPVTLNNIDIENGSIGELILTNLKKEAQPLLRFRTNDIIRILGRGKCECGYNGFSFEVIGRSDDMVVIKGVNVFISSIENILLQFSDLNVGIFHLCVNKNDPIDKVHIYAEVKNQYVDLEQLKDSIKRKINLNLNFTPEVYLLEEDKLQRTAGKTKRLFRTL